MFYRENGQFKTTYRKDQQIFAIAQDRWVILALIAASITYWVANVRRRWLAEELVLLQQRGPVV